MAPPARAGGLPSLLAVAALAATAVCLVAGLDLGGAAPLGTRLPVQARTPPVLAALPPTPWLPSVGAALPQLQSSGPLLTHPDLARPAPTPGPGWAALGTAIGAMAALLLAVVGHAQRGPELERSPSVVALLAVTGSASAPAVEPPEAHHIPPFLNKTPHSADIRLHFYDDALQAVQRAISAGESRMEVRTTFPELNSETDVYRAATMLEMVRHIATALATEGKRVKICVQQSLGQGIFSGLPLSLNGMMKLAKLMDWDEEAVGDRFSFGEVGAGQVESTVDVYLLISPQNITGCSIVELLQGMCKAANGKPIVLINPKLDDIPSSGGVMSYRGREERMEFVATFRTVYHFRLLYRKPYLYPIYGALRMAYGGPWAVYKRIETGAAPDLQEEYRFSRSFPSEPDSGKIMDAVFGSSSSAVYLS